MILLVRDVEVFGMRSSTHWRKDGACGGNRCGCLDQSWTRTPAGEGIEDYLHIGAERPLNIQLIQPQHSQETGLIPRSEAEGWEMKNVGDRG
jgi:hypothetical protein